MKAQRDAVVSPTQLFEFVDLMESLCRQGEEKAVKLRRLYHGCKRHVRQKRKNWNRVQAGRQRLREQVFLKQWQH